MKIDLPEFARIQNILRLKAEDIFFAGSEMRIILQNLSLTPIVSTV